VFLLKQSRQRSPEFPRGDSVRQIVNLVVMVVGSRQATSVVPADCRSQLCISPSQSCQAGFQSAECRGALCAVRGGRLNCARRSVSGIFFETFPAVPPHTEHWMHFFGRTTKISRSSVRPQSVGGGKACIALHEGATPRGKLDGTSGTWLEGVFPCHIFSTGYG